ncbi:hypothetical protein Sru01_37060 [Sphaerisporangium rufum]|uniref:Uncharacterized protein n=1 Tax=Sphaerisporangium rufum TaxID=1381558 RepID=A0A919R355_9ACTN|nr:hypothetical protein [Sphaerisporangium rufum]GII78724.1 hypothetical protein Sru01_37060 [Sphaerisporangium rufum]
MRFLPLAAAGVLGLISLTGCSTADKAQACIEANNAISETGTKITQTLDDPKALEKALNDGAAKLKDVGKEVGDTSLNEALTKLANGWESLDVKNAEDAVKAGQQAAQDMTEAVTAIAKECT